MIVIEAQHRVPMAVPGRALSHLRQETQDLGGGAVRQEQAQGILVAALGMLAAQVGYGEARRTS
jgi:hypothetical protein